MNLLLAISTMHPRDGGPPKVVSGLARALAAKGVKITIVAASEPGDMSFVRQHWSDFPDRGIALELFPLTGPRGLYFSRDLVSYVHANVHRYDALHNHGLWELSLLGAANIFRRSGKPYFVSVHGTLDPWSLAQKRWKKLLALHVLGAKAMVRQASGLIFGTDDERRMAEPLGLGANALVVPNGADLSRPVADRADARAALVQRFPAMVNWQRCGLFFARLHPKKGLDMLVDAFERIAGEYPDAGLLAAAIPEIADYELEIRDSIVRSGLQDRIILTTDLVGHDGRMALDAADFFILPSHQEGFSMSLVEAMGIGLPLLITDRCHMDHIAAAGAGYVVAATVDGLESGLRNMLESETDALVSMSASSRRLAYDYSWPSVAEQMLGHYREAIGQ